MRSFRVKYEWAEKVPQLRERKYDEPIAELCEDLEKQGYEIFAIVGNPMAGFRVIARRRIYEKAE